MTLPNGFDLATDAAFRLVAGFTEPPKAGRVLSIEGNGQARIELDDADGGEVLAWPLNGFDYAPGDVVYVMFAANAPESGIVLGSVAPAPGLPDYAFLPGRSGGQHLHGGRDSGDDLTLESTTHATKGSVRILDPVAIGGDFAPGAELHVLGQGRFGDGAFPGAANLYLSADGFALLRMNSENSGNPEMRWMMDGSTIFALGVDRSDGNKLKVLRNTSLAGSNGFVLDSSGQFGVGTDTPVAPHHVALEHGGHAQASAEGVNGGTPTTILPAGTVDSILQLRALIQPTSGGPASDASTLLRGGGAVTLYSAGGNVLEGEVTAGGALQLQRAAGSVHFTVALDMLWV